MLQDVILKDLTPNVDPECANVRRMCAQPIIPPDLREKPRRPVNSNVRTPYKGVAN